MWSHRCLACSSASVPVEQLVSLDDLARLKDEAHPWADAAQLPFAEHTIRADGVPSKRMLLDKHFRQCAWQQTRAQYIFMGAIPCMTMPTTDEKASSDMQAAAWRCGGSCGGPGLGQAKLRRPSSACRRLEVGQSQGSLRVRAPAQARGRTPVTHARMPCMHFPCTRVSAR